MALTLRARRSRLPNFKVGASLLVLALAMQPLAALPAPSAWALDGSPTVQPCTAESSVVSTSLAGWNLTSSGSRGHNELVSGGLRIYTEGATSTDKAAGYYPTNFALKDLGNKTIAESMNFTPAAGFAASPGLQLAVDFDNNNSFDGFLVGETIYGNNWWLTNSGAQFVKDDAPNTGGGNGSNWFGTPDEWLSKFPDANIMAIGYSMGSGVHGDGVISRISLGCVNYTFDLPPVLTAPQPRGPENGKMTIGNARTFTWNATPNATSYELRYSTSPGRSPNQNDGQLNGSDAQNVTSSTNSLSLTNLPQGWVFWQARAVNGSTQGPWSNIWATGVDSFGPSLSVSSPSQNELFGGLEAHPSQKKTITVSATATDSNNLGAYCVSMTGVSGSCVPNGYKYQPANGALPSVSIDTSTLASGSYVVKARVTDRIGNATEETRTVRVDNSKPVISTNIENGELISGSRTFTMTLTEANPKIYNIRVLNEDGSPASSNGSNLGAYNANNGSNTQDYVFDSTKVNDGTYRIQFSARDAVGNSAETLFRTVIVDNTPEVQPMAVTTITGVQNRTVRGTTTDPNVFLSIAQFDGRGFEGEVKDFLVSNVVNDNGTYGWSFTAPVSIPNDEEKTLEVRLKNDKTGTEYDVATRTVTFTAVPASEPVDGNENGEEQPSTPNNPTPSGGAPVGSSGANNGDDGTIENDNDPINLANLFASTPVAQNPSVVSQFGITPQATNESTTDESDDEGDILGTATTANPAANAAVVAPSTEGWKILGLAWYWWLAIAAGLTGAWLMIAAAIRRMRGMEAI